MKLKVNIKKCLIILNQCYKLCIIILFVKYIDYKLIIYIHNSDMVAIFMNTAIVNKVH